MRKGGSLAIVVAAVVVVLIVAGIFFLHTHLRFGPHSSGSDVQQAFFKAVLSGDSNQVTAMLHPDLLREVDEPVLAQWMAAVKKDLGELKDFGNPESNAVARQAGDGNVTWSSLTVKFAKGDARSELTLVDGKITSFNVTSELLDNDDWFKGLSPDQLRPYQDRGERFLTLFLGGKPDEAYQTMDANFRAGMPLENFKAGVAEVTAKIGAVKSVTHLMERSNPADTLRIFYKVQGEKAATTASGTFKLEYMHFRLSRIDFNSVEDGSKDEPDLQTTFFHAVLSGDPNQVMALFYPTLRDLVDAPVLAQWMGSIKTMRGEWKGVSRTEYHFASRTPEGLEKVQTAAVVDFQKGQARSELTFVDGKLMAFHVAPLHAAGDSNQGPGWQFQGLAPEQMQFYRDRGTRFLRFYFTDRPEDASKMMHESLRAIAPLEKLRAFTADLAGKAGGLKSIEYQSEQIDPAGKVKIFYKVQCEKVATLASVTFRQEGMKYALVSFNVYEKSDSPSTLPTQPAPEAERPAATK